MDIVLSAENNKEIYILPIVPKDSPETNNPYQNETFGTINGEIKIIGEKGLRTLSLNSFFPNKEYSYIKKGASSNGWEYVNWLLKKANEKKPIRIVISTKDGQERLNMPVTIDSLIYYVDKVGDIQYTLNLSEYILLGV